MKKIGRIPLLIILIAGVVLAVAGFYYLPNGSANGNTANMPAQQRQFCERLIAANRDYERLIKARDSEANPLRQETLGNQLAQIAPKAWDDLYALVGPEGEFKEWRGNLGFRRYRENYYGAVDKGLLEVYTGVCSGSDFGFDQTFDAGLGTVDTGYQNTHVPLSSALGQYLASLDLSRTSMAFVSGKFIWAEKNKNWPNMGQSIPYGYHFVPNGGNNLRLDYRSPVLGVSFVSIRQAH